MIHTGDEVIDAYRKVSLWGVPKQSGKSTFAASVPGEIHINHYDWGTPTIPPGKDPKQITYKTYPVADPVLDVKSDKWKRAINIGEEILRDLMEWRAAFMENRPAKIDGQEVRLPQTFVLDGWVSLGQSILDWMLGLNNLKDPSESENAMVDVYGRRLTNYNTIFNTVIPLPCNVIIVTWETPVTRREKDYKGRPIQVETGKVTADYGGKLDMYGNGKVDASLYCYSEKTSAGTRFKVRTKSTELLLGIGVRGIYDLPDVVDVTIDPKKPHPLPWERIFGKRNP